MKMFSFIMLKGESGMGSEVLYGHRNSFLESEFCVNEIFISIYKKSWWDAPTPLSFQYNCWIVNYISL